MSRKFPLLGRVLSEKQIDFFSTFFPPVYISEINGIISQATGKEIKGWFIACPYTPRRMLELPEKTVYRKIVQTGHLAEKLGAHQYIDSNVADTVAELQKLGGARVILATAPSAKAISAVIEGLGVNGNLLVPAAPTEPLSVNVLPLIMGRRSVSGCYSGTARDSQDTLEFSAFNDVHPMIEKYPLNRVADAYQQMHSGKVRFRVVLTMQ